jgi:hypothetical protein
VIDYRNSKDGGVDNRHNQRARQAFVTQAAIEIMARMSLTDAPSMPKAATQRAEAAWANARALLAAMPNDVKDGSL